MAAAKDSYIVVFVTTATEENAATIGRALVEERLAAVAAPPGCPPAGVDSGTREAVIRLSPAACCRLSQIPSASIKAWATFRPEYCCWPVISRPSRTTNALNRPPWT